MLISNALNKTCTCVCTSSRTGAMFIQEILNDHPRRCYEAFRIHVMVFKMSCSDLVTHYGLKSTRNLSVEELVAIFLITLAHECGNRLVQETFILSTETIHRHFYTLFKAELKLSKDIIKPKANFNEEVSSQFLNNSRYYLILKVFHITLLHL